MKRNEWEINKWTKNGRLVVTLEADGNPLTNQDILEIASLLLEVLKQRSK